MENIFLLPPLTMQNGQEIVYGATIYSMDEFIEKYDAAPETREWTDADGEVHQTKSFNLPEDKASKKISEIFSENVILDHFEPYGDPNAYARFVASGWIVAKDGYVYILFRPASNRSAGGTF